MSGVSTGELLVRLVFSLGIIVGVLLLAAKFARKNGGRLPGLGKRHSSIKVIDRQQLSKTASLAVVQVHDKTMVVGISEHGISMLSEGPALADLESSAAVAANDVPVPREAKGTLPLGASLAVETASGSGHPPRMSFVEALRELTVRKA